MTQLLVLVQVLGLARCVAVAGSGGRLIRFQQGTWVRVCVAVAYADKTRTKNGAPFHTNNTNLRARIVKRRQSSWATRRKTGWRITEAVGLLHAPGFFGGSRSRASSLRGLPSNDPCSDLPKIVYGKPLSPPSNFDRDSGLAGHKTTPPHRIPDTLPHPPDGFPWSNCAESDSCEHRLPIALEGRKVGRSCGFRGGALS